MMILRSTTPIIAQGFSPSVNSKQMTNTQTVNPQRVRSSDRCFHHSYFLRWIIRVNLLFLSLSWIICLKLFSFTCFNLSLKIIQAILLLKIVEEKKKTEKCWPFLVVTHPCSWSTLLAGPHGPVAGSRCQQRDEACWTPRRPSARWGPGCSRSTENPETTSQVSHALFMSSNVLIFCQSENKTMTVIFSIQLHFKV